MLRQSKPFTAASSPVCLPQPHSWGVKESEGALRRSVGSRLLLLPLMAMTVNVGQVGLVRVIGQTVLVGTPVFTPALRHGQPCGAAAF